MPKVKTVSIRTYRPETNSSHIRASVGDALMIGAPGGTGLVEVYNATTARTGLLPEYVYSSHLAIDFGSNFCAIAQWNAKTPMEIYQKSRIFVGVDYLSTKPPIDVGNCGSIRSIKRLVSSLSDGSRLMLLDDLEIHGSEIMCPGQSYHIRDIITAFFAEIKGASEKVTGLVWSKVFVSVPNAWSYSQRLLIKSALESAGFTTAYTIPQGMAIAASAIIRHKLIAPCFLVVSMGESTTDISVFNSTHNNIKCLGKSGKASLGGLQFTMALVDHVLDTCNVSKSSLSAAEYRDIFQQCEEAKLQLSVSNSVRICKFGGIEIDRETFAKVCQPLYAELKMLIFNCLADSQIPRSQVDAVFVSGGSARLTYFSEFLRGAFGDRVKFMDESAVIDGVAVISGIESGYIHAKYTDVLSRSIGLEGISSRMVPVLGRNNVYPIIISKTITAANPGQNIARVLVYEGDNKLVSQNYLLASIDFVFSESRSFVVDVGVDDEGIIFVNLHYLVNATNQVERHKVNDYALIEKLGVCRYAQSEITSIRVCDDSTTILLLSDGIDSANLLSDGIDSVNQMDVSGLECDYNNILPIANECFADYTLTSDATFSGIVHLIEDSILMASAEIRNVSGIGDLGKGMGGIGHCTIVLLDEIVAAIPVFAVLSWMDSSNRVKIHPTLPGHPNSTLNTLMRTLKRGKRFRLIASPYPLICEANEKELCVLFNQILRIPINDFQRQIILFLGSTFRNCGDNMYFGQMPSIRSHQLLFESLEVLPIPDPPIITRSDETIDFVNGYAGLTRIYDLFIELIGNHERLVLSQKLVCTGNIVRPEINKAFFVYEDKLHKLQIQLDGIETFGHEELRNSRKYVTVSIQKRLDQLDRIRGAYTSISESVSGR